MARAATNETGLTRQIRAAILKRYPDAWQFKVHGSGYQMSGVPDLLVVVEGRLVGLEVKFQRPGESVFAARRRASPGQLKQIRAIRAAGGTAGVVLSVEGALRLIRTSLRS